MDSKTLGQKIRDFRKRAGVSQFDLEIKIDASPGSLSRIESGEVNPTKETLSKIANALKLKPAEIAYLLDLKILTTEELILAIQSFSNTLDLNTTLQTAVDIMFGLFPNYNGGIIFLRDEERPNSFRARTISRDIPNLKKFLGFLPFPLDKIYVDMANNNLATDTMKNKRVNQSNKLSDFGKNVVSEFVSDSIQKVSGYKYGITMPMIFDEDLIGITFFTKSIEEIFDDYEIKLLELLTNQIAISISNALKYEKLKEEIELLRTQKFN